MGGEVRLADKEIETKRGNKQTGNTVTKTNKQTNKQGGSTVTKDKQICFENTPSNVNPYKLILEP